MTNIEEKMKTFEGQLLENIEQMHCMLKFPIEQRREQFELILTDAEIKEKMNGYYDTLNELRQLLQMVIMGGQDLTFEDRAEMYDRWDCLQKGTKHFARVDRGDATTVIKHEK